MSRRGRTILNTGVVIAVALVAGCGGSFENLDLDLRNNAPGGLDTSSAARAAAADRPRADANGLITYPNYQVAVARRGDTVASVAARIGIAPDELARFNGLQSDSELNRDAVLALPRRVTPTAGGTARPDITQIAGAAIDRADGAAPAAVAVQGGQEPVRHRVARGETAFSISRLYGVSPASLAEWNGLDSDLGVREGQYLLIPLVIGDDGATQFSTSTPGVGSSTPVPPSASSALPETVQEEALPASPNLDQFRTDVTAEPDRDPDPEILAEVQVSDEPGALRRPVSGDVLRPFSDRNEGVDFRAAEGAPVSAAAAGTVAAITRDTDQVPILVLRHEGGLLTVYANIKDIQVKKDDAIRAGQRLASVGAGNPAFLHFEVRRGFDAIDPEELLD